MTPPSPLSDLTDQALLAETVRLADRERAATARLVAALAEIDARRLYLGEGCSSLFVYCTRVLHLSEHAAYGRIEAARAARRFPIMLELLEDGSLTLTTVGLLSPLLTAENHRALLRAARYKSKREVEHQVAALRPQPAVPSTIRKLPEPKLAAPKLAAPVQAITTPALRSDASPAAPIPASPPPARPPMVKPLASERYQVRFTISRETHNKLRRAQDLLRHAIPDGDPVKIFDKALTLLLADIERKKFAAAARPRQDRITETKSRHIPASVKRAVWKRDGGRCAFSGAHGRCEERGFLEFHHVKPYAAGGAAVVENLELRCRSHNAYEAELFFGMSRPPMVREMRCPYSCDGATRSGPS